MPAADLLRTVLSLVHTVIAHALPPNLSAVGSVTFPRITRCVPNPLPKNTTDTLPLEGAFAGVELRDVAAAKRRVHTKAMVLLLGLLPGLIIRLLVKVTVRAEPVKRGTRTFTLVSLLQMDHSAAVPENLKRQLGSPEDPMLR